MTTINIPPIVNELLSLFRQLPIGEYGIALGGAHAKGVDDAESDVDVYVFAHEVLPNDERARLAASVADASPPMSIWGQTAPFDQAGTDFYVRGIKIECWLRNADHIAATIAECREGVVRRDLVTWTTTGFYNHCALSDVYHMAPVEDPAGLLAHWKADVAVYPPKLREAIIACHLPAAHFWPRNFHYASAVERADIIYTTGIIQQVIHNLIQVVFALNGAYFPGDKKLNAVLSHLPTQPEQFVPRIERLIFPAAEPDRALLRRQREELICLVDEVDRLAHGQESAA